MWRISYQRILSQPHHSRRYLRALRQINLYTKNMHVHHKEIAVLYHGGCPDGFGGAYAAWKKFDDTADYIPLKHGKPAPENLDGKELYFIDFCYPQPIMEQLRGIAKS